MSSEAAILILPVIFFLHRADFSCFIPYSSSFIGGLSFGVEVLKLKQHLLDFLVYQRIHACGLFVSTPFWLLQKKQEMRYKNSMGALKFAPKKKGHRGLGFLLSPMCTK